MEIARLERIGEEAGMEVEISARYTWKIVDRKDLKMAEELTTEQRLSALEQQFAEMKRDLAANQSEQETLDDALLARIDGFIASLARMERSQLTIFQQVMTAHKFHDLRIDAIEKKLDSLETNVAAIPAILASHKESIEQLAQGQAQIIALLTRQKRND